MISIAFLLAIALQAADPYAPPPSLDRQSACACPASVKPDVTISGYVIDAQMLLGANRRSVEERMATIFDVKQSSDPDISGRTKVWHNVKEDLCGVTFDYGKKYSVPARYGENGELETDACLMGW
jgi:hypothetical protein